MNCYICTKMPFRTELGTVELKTCSSKCKTQYRYDQIEADRLMIEWFMENYPNNVDPLAENYDNEINKESMLAAAESLKNVKRRKLTTIEDYVIEAIYYHLDEIRVLHEFAMYLCETRELIDGRGYLLSINYEPNAFDQWIDFIRCSNQLHDLTEKE